MWCCGQTGFERHPSDGQASRYERIRPEAAELVELADAGDSPTRSSTVLPEPSRAWRSAPRSARRTNVLSFAPAATQSNGACRRLCAPRCERRGPTPRRPSPHRRSRRFGGGLSRAPAADDVDVCTSRDHAGQHGAARPLLIDRAQQRRVARRVHVGAGRHELVEEAARGPRPGVLVHRCGQDRPPIVRVVRVRTRLEKRYDRFRPSESEGKRERCVAAGVERFDVLRPEVVGNLRELPASCASVKWRVPVSGRGRGR